MSYTSWIEAVKSVGSGEEHKAGEVWKTEHGNWRSKNPAGDPQSYVDKNDAKTWAKGKIPAAAPKDEPKAEPEKKSEKDPEVRAAVSPEKISKSIEDARAKLAEKAKKPEEKLSDEDVQTTNALLDDLEKLNGMSGDEREKFGKEIIDKYKLTTNAGGKGYKKLYIGSIKRKGSQSYKALGGGSPTTQNFHDMLKEYGLSTGGGKSTKIGLGATSKPELATASKPGDENVDKIFGADPVFLSKLDPKYKGVMGPLGKDGKILHPSSDHSKEYFQQSVNENTAIKNTIAELKKMESPPTNMSPKMRGALEDHQKRLEELRDNFDNIKDPK